MHRAGKGAIGISDRMKGCLDPGTVSPDDLLAYTRGEAAREVAVHVQLCAVCRATAQSYARLDRFLAGALRRRTCPPPLTLGNYALHLLSAADERGVADHLDLCRFCRQDLRALIAFLDEPDPGQATGIG